MLISIRASIHYGSIWHGKKIDNSKYFSVDCKWGEYKTLFCSKTCGGGVKWRKRSKKIRDENGGKPCEGNALQMVECNNQVCTGKDRILQRY